MYYSPEQESDLQVHPRDRDLIVATYGRGAFIADIFPFKELKPELLEKEIHLFNIEPKPQLNYSQQAYWGNNRLMGDSQISTPNEANGILLYFYHGKDSEEKIRVSIRSNTGDLVYEVHGCYKKGFHCLRWDTTEAKPGIYDVTLEKGDIKLQKQARVLERWKWAVGNVGSPLNQHPSNTE